MYRLGGVGLQDLPGHEEVEQAPEGCEVLFDGCGGPVVLLDVGSDVDRLYVG